jgi:uncharacterized protein
MMRATTPLSLTSTWFLKPGCEADALRALEALADTVRETEPGTLIYLVHTPFPTTALQSLPPMDKRTVLFFEMYRDVEAFQKHVTGPAFTQFVKDYGGHFLASDGSRFSFVQFLTRHAGFIRGESSQAVGAAHPAVMFEVIAADQETSKAFYKAVFGWTYRDGTGNFAYVDFHGTTPSLLGGIGQANDEPGFAAGTNFYLLVDNVAAALKRAVNAGGSVLMERTELDGFTFAMFTDPEGNPVGLIEPF